MKLVFRRQGKAALVVVACMLIALLGDALARASQPSVRGDVFASLVSAGDSVEAFPSGSESEGVDFEGLLYDGEPWTEGLEGGIPEGFAEEVIPLEGYTDVRVGAAGAVVGFTTAAAPQEAFEAISQTMIARGWTVVSSGSNAVGSFVKAAGFRTWACVTCVQVGDSTSVVVQCAKGSR